MVVADHELRVPAGSNNDVLDTTKCERREDVVSGKRGTMMMYSVGCLVVCTCTIDVEKSMARTSRKMFSGAHASNQPPSLINAAQTAYPAFSCGLVQPVQLVQLASGRQRAHSRPSRALIELE
ncbi:hypothetical protein MY3957_005613, partial [Beauveria namnaoensis]